MSSGSLYSIRYSESKTLQNYLNSLEKAAFAKVAQVQIDFEILVPSRNAIILDEALKRGFGIAIRCNLFDLPALLVREQNCKFSIHVFFEGKQEELTELKFLLSESSVRDIHFIINGTRKTQFESVLGIFKEQQYRQLYISFPPYNSASVDALTVKEISKILRSAKINHPEFELKPLPGFEPFDERIDREIELEATIREASFEFSNNSAHPPTFSIIIPTFNAKFFLANVVRHLRLQKISPEDFEVIIVDDGGTDGTKDFLLSYLRSEGNQHSLRYFYWPKPTENKTPIFRAGLARNLGAGHAKGKYLVFLDSDILVDENFLERLKENLKTHSVVQSVRQHIVPEKSNVHIQSKDVDLKKDTYIEEASYWKPFFEAENWQELNYFWKYTCTYCLALSAEDFFKVGRFRRLFVSYGFEDTDLGYRLAKMGRSFLLEKQPTLHLTDKPSYAKSLESRIARHSMLSQTAKIFFILNLDLEIYLHFKSFMGGEKSFIRSLRQSFGKFFNRKANS